LQYVWTPRLSSDVSEIKIAFGIPPARPTPNFAPSWNLAPTDPAPVVCYDAKDSRRLEVMRWGLIPYWAKEVKISFSTINARAEEVDSKPAFPRPSSVGVAWYPSTASMNGCDVKSCV
jgi:putative SOS response-associated peptidase YedK